MLLSVCVADAFSQDARMAHPFVWQSYYNPASIGADGNYQINLGEQTSYTQKNSLFSTTLLSAEMPLELFGSQCGAGLKFQHDYEGGGLINLTDISAMFSIGVDLSSNSFLQFGLEPDFYCRYIDKSKMVMGDQLDPYYGIVSDESSHMEEIQNDKLYSFDFSVGLYGSSYLGKDAYYHDIILKYGVSGFHLIGANSQSFFSEDGETFFAKELYNRRYCAYLEGLFPIVFSEKNPNQSMYNGTYVLYERQHNMNNFQIGTYLNDGKIGLLGVGLKLERFDNIIIESCAFHVGGNFKLDHYGDRFLRIMYTFQTPFVQGNVLGSSIHSLSLHYYFDKEQSKKRFKCIRSASFKKMQKSVFD